MSMRTNRKTKGTFKVGNPMDMGTVEYGRGMKSVKGYKLIQEKAEKIVKFEQIGSPYVEDGDGALYKVTMGDGRTAEVEFSDALDNSEGPFEDEDLDEDAEYRNVYVVWDGAVDFAEDYNANKPDQVAEIKASLIERYGDIARDWLGA